MTAGIVPRNSTSPWTRPCNGCATTYRGLQQARLGGDENEAAIFSAHLALLEDPGLLDAADMLIDQGVGAAHAWHRAIQAQCEILQALGNLLLAERANDLRDLENACCGCCSATPHRCGCLLGPSSPPGRSPPTSRRWWMPARLACAWPKAAPPPRGHPRP